jgi:tetratricopeptide (TPR) repeat protein
LRRAQQVAPTNAAVVAAAAELAHTFGQTEKAVELARQSVSLDPVNINTRASLALALSNADHPKEAEAELRRAMEMNPQAAWLHTPLGENLLRQKRFDEAALEAERTPVEIFRLTVRAMALWSLNRRPEADAALARLTDVGAETAAYQIAQVHAYRRETDRAFEWLERAFRQRDSGLIHVKPDRVFATLYGDARWAAFLRKVGLADEQLN